jgi:hypothetical protein
MAFKALNPALAVLPFPHCMCFAIAAKRIFGKVTYEWQAFVIQGIIEGDIRQDPKAMLVVRPTGAARAYYGMCAALFSTSSPWWSPPLLLLGGDQTLKVNSRALPDVLTVGAFHLDELSPSECEKLLSVVANHGPSGMESIILFLSPQALLNASARFFGWLPSMRRSIFSFILWCHSGQRSRL